MKIEDVKLNQKYKANLLTEQDKEIFLSWFDEKDIGETFVVEKITDLVFLHPQNFVEEPYSLVLLDDDVCEDIIKLLSLFEPI